MIARTRRLAPHILAAGAILAAFGLFWTLIRGRLELTGEIALVAGLVAIAAYIALEPGRVRRALAGRTARQGGNATIVTLAVIGILMLLNVLAARHHKRFDLTAEREFSLSPQTLQVLAELEEPVAVTAYMTPYYYGRQQVEDLLKEYSYRTDKLQVEYVDPEQNPGQARQAGVTRDGTIVFEMADRRQEALGSDEQALTSALVKVTREEAKKVYFLTGHGERGRADTGAMGYSQVASALTRDNYQVEDVNLAVSSTVPSDAAVLIIAAPTTALSADEFKAINTYVDGGGSLLVVGDPASEVDLSELLGRWGLSLRRDVVIDPLSGFFGDAMVPLVSRFPYHEITKDLGGLSTIYQVAGSIETSEQAPEGVISTPLVQTSDASWGETDLETPEARMDAEQDNPGPLDLAVAAALELPAAESEEARHARLVLFGDADFCANDVLQAVQGSLGNVDLFVNATNWLAEEEALISIRATPSTPRMVMLTQPQVRMVMYTSMLFLPGIVVVAGVWVWWKRR